MASTGFTKRDANRFRKVYPFIRRTPRYEIFAGKSGVIIEVAEVSFAGVSSVEYIFQDTYDADPIVTVTNKSSTSTVNLAITALSTTAVTIGASTSWTGTAEVHIIYIP
jgi:hypothetical protein